MNKAPRLMMLFAAIVISIACSLPASTPQLATPVPTQAKSEQTTPIETSFPAALPQPTSINEQVPATETPTVYIQPTDSAPYVFAPQNTNCRLGPDVIYEAVGYLMTGETSEIVARNPQGTWVAVKNLDRAGVCYVSLTVVEAYGIESIMVLTAFTPPPPPTFTPTSPPTLTYTPELPTAPGPDEPQVVVSPPSAPIPETYTLKIIDFDSGEIVTINIYCVCGGSPYTLVDQFQVTMDGNGNFTTSWTSESGDPTGGYFVQAIGGNGTNGAITEFGVE